MCGRYSVMVSGWLFPAGRTTIDGCANRRIEVRLCSTMSKIVDSLYNAL